MGRPPAPPDPAAPAPILVVGSVALDEITTPAGHRDEVVGGTAVNFSAAASLFAPVQLVGVIGDDYPTRELDFLRCRGTDLSGLERRPGRSFRWGAVYREDMNTRDTAYTELGCSRRSIPRSRHHSGVRGGRSWARLLPNCSWPCSISLRDRDSSPATP